MPRRIEGDGMTPRFSHASQSRQGVADSRRITSFYGLPMAFAHNRGVPGTGTCLAAPQYA
jgi:hypothetical protein